MTREWISLIHVDFGYDTATAPLIRDLTAHFPKGWTGIVGANGAGKTTLLKLATGQMKPDRGEAQIPQKAFYCPQRTDDAPPHLEDLLQSEDGHAIRLMRVLRIEPDWMERWDSLSHGERKRAQIGVALWLSPPALAVDEPTNHLDREGRRLLLEGLRLYEGVGLLVSHDRELLDALCGQCLFLNPPEAVMRPGGYTAASQEIVKEEQSQRKAHEEARSERRRLEREAQRRYEEAMKADKMRSKRHLDPKDRDAKGKIDLARVSGKDGQAGRLLRQMRGRVEKARNQEQELQARRIEKTGIWTPGEISKRDLLLFVAEGSLPLGEARELHFPDLAMKPDDRIALAGPNGAGKSTLLGHMLNHLRMETERLVYIPQEISLELSKQILAEVRRLSRPELGQLMMIVSRLNSRPERLLETDEPSPGEVRKILLGLGILKEPHLIILDEPTNHMDLPSIEALEESLQDCPCGLLLVSHDLRFLGKLTKKQWHITCGQDGIYDLRIDMVVDRSVLK